MPDDAAYQRRSARHEPALVAALHGVYGARPDFPAWLASFLAAIAARETARPAALRARDLACEADPGWFLRPDMLGYSCYVDRFAGGLADLAGRIPYLQKLGIRYLHLLPFWDVEPGDNDGGFAVRDYRRVSPRFGTIEELPPRAEQLSEAGITLCADLVLNHTADTHAWAKAARAGDPVFRDYYHVIASRAEVDAFEAHLPQVFPETAPGNFTHVPEMGGWVWTTFYPFQWDLNYANPAVFSEMACLIMDLANFGIGAFRLDSAAFLWKRLGTNSRSQPETHLVMRALRAMVDIFAPSVLLKSEVIAPVADAAAYLGSDAHPECHLAYHAGLMTAGWAALAEQDAGTVGAVLQAVPALPAHAGWITYVRCHDDIGLQPLAPQAGSEATGLDAASVQRRLRSVSDFYTSGQGFARGAAFQSGSGQSGSLQSGSGGMAHGINGMAASLAGLETARTPAGVEAALARLMLLYGLAFAAGGLPLIYMGDELGLMNDWSFENDPVKAHEGRWLHRPVFDEAAARHSEDGQSLAGRVRKNLDTLRRARLLLPGSDPGTAPRIVAQAAPAVLGFARGAGMTAVFNFSAETETAFAPGEKSWRDVLTDRPWETPMIELPAWGMAWFLTAKA